MAVIGAGPAGLAVAACLERAGVPYEMLEREGNVGSAWRRHYDRLHLHTSRGFSSLPFHSMPKRYPRYPSRAQVVEYLEEYARTLALRPRFGVEVRRIDRDAGGWTVDAAEGSLRCAAVVLATGVNGNPKRPTWPGVDTFSGPVAHSSEYRNGASFRGRDVLVVGFGNSGGEIALDLLEHGARPVVSVRSPVNVIPRDILGMPVLGIAVLLAKLPAGLADILTWPILKAYYPSYSRLGLRKAPYGPFRQIREHGRIPLLDIGTVAEIRRGRILVERGIVRIAGPKVRFESGRTLSFDGIILATGYEPRLPRGVSVKVATDPVGPVAGLYFCGFYVSPTGMLREIGIEARRIVADIVRRRRRSRGSRFP